MLDIYNLLNAGTVTTVNTTFGAVPATRVWNNPQTIQGSRYVRFGAQILDLGLGAWGLGDQAFPISLEAAVAEPLIRPAVDRDLFGDHVGLRREDRIQPCTRIVCDPALTGSLSARMPIGDDQSPIVRSSTPVLEPLHPRHRFCLGIPLRGAGFGERRAAVDRSFGAQFQSV